MSIKAPSFSETSWLGTIVLVLGFIASILGLAYIFWPQTVVLLAIGAGFGWALAAALFVVNGMHRTRIADSETHLSVARSQADAWAAAAADASAASKTVAELFRPQIPMPTPRKRKAGQ